MLARWRLRVVLFGLLIGLAPSICPATTIVLKNGQILDGNLGQVSGLMENLIGAATDVIDSDTTITP